MNLDIIKRLTLRALMSDENLFYRLVLKGGNALQMVHQVINRSSIDIDFSIEGEFNEEELKDMEIRLKHIFDKTFLKEGLKTFDIKFKLKPKNGDIPEWKGYNIEFKTIESDKYESLVTDEARRRNAIKIDITNQSPKFTVDISAYEYVDEATKVEIDGVLIKVYTLDMILLEKLRALCQTMPKYKDIVSTINPDKKRARDIYDICQIYNIVGVGITDKKELLEEIFKAKQVPLSLLKDMEELRERNRLDWETVLADIPEVEKENMKEYDDYFNKVLEIVEYFIVQ
jgi:hypothetical protein